MRANEKWGEICCALISLDDITRAIHLGSDLETLLSLTIMLQDHGHSLALARKMAFVLGHYPKDSESWRFASKSFSQYGADARNYGMMAVADSIGVEFSYLGVKAAFAGFASYGPRSTASQRLSYLSFNPISFDTEAALDGLAAAYSFSLLDATLHLLNHRSLGVLKAPIPLHPDIEATWDQIQPADYAFDKFFDSEDSHADLRAFRASPAFLEYRAFREFRAATQDLYDSADARQARPAAPNPYEDAFYTAATEITDLLSPEIERFDPLPNRFDKSSAGSLARSCGLARIASKNPDFAELTRSQMGNLMGCTTEIDRLLSTSSLRAGAKSATDVFVKLILQTLLRTHSPSTKDTYQFKQVFQSYIQNTHNSDIVQFIESVYQLNSHIVEYFVLLLDETMLSQMPFLIRTSEDVYETRAKLLEWYSTKSGNSIWKDKAKELRIDRKIASVRGQINETRLNIDAIRFRQWIESSKLAEFSGFIRQEFVEIPLGADFRGKRALPELRLTAHRDPNARALVALIDCYREFCVNADFGVASYLGRRIRHGTLRGTLLDGLPDVNDPNLSNSSRQQYERWLATFRSSIDTITSKLHFSGRGVSNQAVISPEIDTKEKLDILIVCLRTIHEKSQKDHGAATIPLIAEQYCWYVFELELRDVQSAILESRSEFGNFKLKYGVGDPSAIGFEKTVNIALTQRFQTVASWFKKPPNISPVAQISDIIEVALREAKAEYPSFDPLTTFNGTEVELSGGVYYHVYDALSIVVKNAAKHGSYPGRLSISASIDERELGKALRLDIITEVKDGDTAVRAIARMELAGRAGPANADVVEGHSGVRKLHKMRLEGSLLDFEATPASAVGKEITMVVLFRLSGIV